jgi:flagellar biosynthesis regulator FlaF
MIKQEQADMVNSNSVEVASTKEEIVATVDTVAVVAMAEATKGVIEEDTNSVETTTRSTRLLCADISNKQANVPKEILAHLLTVIMSFVVYKM